MKKIGELFDLICLCLFGVMVLMALFGWVAAHILTIISLCGINLWIWVIGTAVIWLLSVLFLFILLKTISADFGDTDGDNYYE